MNLTIKYQNLELYRIKMCQYEIIIKPPIFNYQIHTICYQDGNPTFIPITQNFVTIDLLTVITPLNTTLE